MMGLVMPVVVIVGMPGVGKSTVRRQLAARLAADWAPVQWSIDDVLEIQCPEGVAEFSGAQLYVRDGGHFLMHDEWRPGQMRRATRGLLVLARATGRLGAFTRPPVLLLELPLTELATFRLAVTEQPDLAGLVTVLHCDRSVRWARNARRPAHRRLPQQVLEYFEQAMVGVDVSGECARLSANGWTVLTQETTRPPELLAEHLAALVHAAAGGGDGAGRDGPAGD
ncbi:hypothetical protein [Micromonospora sp. NPDC049645]|uniref:hypothetical protein n=1 Tax=Micromonospora sp. NPDC049645 TaxID=3155508 RepID=UPI003440E119